MEYFAITVNIIVAILSVLSWLGYCGVLIFGSKNDIPHKLLGIVILIAGVLLIQFIWSV